MFLTSALGGIESAIPANAGCAHTGGPQQVLSRWACPVAAAAVRQVWHAAEAPVYGAPACQAATSCVTVLSKLQAKLGGDGAGQAKKSFFSAMMSKED
jgi:hypothetical protein